MPSREMPKLGQAWHDPPDRPLQRPLAMQQYCRPKPIAMEQFSSDQCCITGKAHTKFSFTRLSTLRDNVDRVRMPFKSDDSKTKDALERATSPVDQVSEVQGKDASIEILTA